MKQLWINGKLIDLGSDVIAFTYQVNDLAELQDRQASYSNEFSIPKTQNNIQALGFLDDVNSFTLIPYRKLPASFINEDGTAIIEEGYAIIKGSGQEIKILLVSGLFDFFTLISGKTLRDIDFSNLDHIYDKATIKAINENESNVIAWPFVNYINGATRTYVGVDLREQYPQIKLSYVLDRIFALTPYKYSGNIFGFPEFKDLFMTLTPDELVEEEASRLTKEAKLHTDTNFMPEFAGKTNYVGNRQGFSSGTSGFIDKNSIELLALFKDTTTGDAYEGSANPIKKYISTADKLYPRSYQGYYNLSRYQAPSNSIVDVTLHIYISNAIPFTIGQGVYLDCGPYLGISVPTRTPYYLDDNGLLEVTFSGIRLRQGQDLRPRIYFGDVVSRIPTIHAKGFAPGTESDYSYIEFKVRETRTIGDNISYNSIMPDISLIDIVRSTCNLFGIVVDKKKGVNELIFNQFKQITADLTKADDWSDKLDLSEEPEITFRIGKYAKSNYMLWTEDVGTDFYGNSEIEINDTTLEQESTLFQLPFSASVPYNKLLNSNGGPDINGVSIPVYELLKEQVYSPLTEYAFGDLVLFENKIWYVTDVAGGVINVTPGTDPTKWALNERQFEQVYSANVRLLYKKKRTGLNFQYGDGEGSPLNATTLYYSVFDDVSYSLHLDRIKSNNYKEVSRMLNRLKAVRCKIYLSSSDISKLNFFTPKYISYFNEYFYLNKVSEYVEGQPCTIELIRI